MEKKKLSVVKNTLIELEYEHRDLDDAIVKFLQDSEPDQLQITRMKKRKLKIKDQIIKLKSDLIPDMDA